MCSYSTANVLYDTPITAQVRKKLRTGCEMKNDQGKNDRKQGSKGSSERRSSGGRE